ncbi:MAG: oligosaccharide flippase family protein [Cryomorphaceae bacterium]|nr:oligosaccharide flippase family protein [Cryomorphaceae bacterium]
MNPLKKLASQTAIYGLSSVVGRLLNYLLVPLYTRYFLPAEYGVVTELYAYVAFLVVMLTYGMETAFFRFSKKEESTKVYSTTLISLLISSVVFVGLIFLNSSAISQWLGYANHPEYIQFFALIIGMDAVASISFAKLREQDKAMRFAFIRIINIMVNIGLNLYFIVYQEYGIAYIFIANLVASVITLLMLFPQMISSSWVFDKKLWKKMMIYALPLLIAGLAGMTNETIDRILLKHLLPNTDMAASELGLYGAFYKLSIIMILFIQTFRFAAEPFFFAQEKEGNSRKIYADVMKYFTIIMAIIFLGVTIFYDVLKGFLGSEYHDDRGFLVVSILLLANLFLGIYYNLSIWYKLTEKTKYGAYLSIFGAIITLSLNFTLIPVLGFVGCAWATLVCYFSMTVASYYLGKRHFSVPYQVKRIALYLFGMLCIYFCIYFTNLNMWINSLFLLGFVIFVYRLEKPKLALKL